MVAGPGAEVAPWPTLFTPEERLGWSFSDRNRLRREFTEPQPDAAPTAEDDSDRLHAARKRLSGLLAWTWRIAAVGAVVAWALLVRRAAQPGQHLSPKSVLIAGAIGAVVGAVAWVGLLLVYIPQSAGLDPGVRRFSCAVTAPRWRRGLLAERRSRIRRAGGFPSYRSGSRLRLRANAVSMWSAGTCGDGRPF